ncbi:hypothetical protein GMRT_12055 [Giardia muris]|uniref:Uncharacterized protein n=1 Tax=Giardia muris TaxID=5742 RepID=A0A4Z1T1B0_GIAMU|nr:hypothetical protein GMRT_12055 [Giardia muris]|eukprot:TNJ27703.1 hypothetical protein GMRT_12055 [Giardia muris]
MDPRTVSKAEFRTSLTRVLSRTAHAQRTLRARRDALGADAAPPLAPEIQILEPPAPPASTLTVEQMLGQPCEIFGAGREQREPPQRELLRDVRDMRDARDVREPALVPREDNGGYVLVHVADVTLARGLQALMPTRTLGRLRLVIDAPPALPQELTEACGTFLAPYGAVGALTFSLLGSPPDDDAAAPAAFEVPLGVAQLDARRLVAAQVRLYEGGGERTKLRLSRRRVSCLSLTTLPLYAVASGYGTVGYQGNLLLGALEVSVLFGGACLLGYEQTLRARAFAHLNLDASLGRAETRDVAVDCALETPEDRECHRRRAELAEFGADQTSGARGHVEAKLRRGELARVASLTCLVRVSRVFLDLSSLGGGLGSAPKKVYVVATLQPTRELAGVVGYRYEGAPELAEAARRPGTSMAAELVPLNAHAPNESLFYADVRLTLGRRLALTPQNVAYLQRGRVSVSVFAYPRKALVGAVALPLVECYAAGVLLGGWFALTPGGFVYADVALANDGARDDWTLAEAPPPPTFAPPAFGLAPGCGENRGGENPDFGGFAGAPAKGAPLLAPDETVHASLNAIVDDLATVLTALDGL